MGRNRPAISISIFQFYDIISFLLQWRAGVRILRLTRTNGRNAMILNLALGLVFATQAPVATTAAELQSQPATDAAYSELASGRADEAVQRIESARADGTVTAAQLLNLGT